MDLWNIKISQMTVLIFSQNQRIEANPLKQIIKLIFSQIFPSKRKHQTNFCFVDYRHTHIFLYLKFNNNRKYKPNKFKIDFNISKKFSFITLFSAKNRFLKCCWAHVLNDCWWRLWCHYVLFCWFVFQFT